MQTVMTKHNFLDDVYQSLQFNEELAIDHTLYKLGTRLLELMRDKSSFVILVFGEAQRNPIMAEKLEALIDGGVTALSDFLDQRAQNGEIKDLDHRSLARHFIGSLFMYFMTYGKSHSETDHKVYLNTTIQALYEGIKTT